MTPDSYKALLDEQGGRCAICNTDDPSPKVWFCVDHDHACCPEMPTCGRCNRGLLCDGCNRMIGGDDPERLRAGARYIEFFAAKQPRLVV